ncbi:DUF3265 domain-containing protein [Vibrio parahaemolyticus]|nr:DUF3265 domain-containing protein [Vibrio parahaemolyticus]
MVVCIERAGKIHITRRLRGIHAAWHFWYAVSFSCESGLRKIGLGGIHPLTQRYTFFEFTVRKQYGCKYKFSISCQRDTENDIDKTR